MRGKVAVVYSNLNADSSVARESQLYDRPRW
jgi:hypothetical protein